METTTGAEELRAEVEKLPFWWHSIDLGDSVVTPGHKSQEHLKQELATLRLPDLAGLSVLDIGAWDGFFSFSAERLGAARVVALDHFVWSIHREAKRAPGSAPRSATPDAGWSVDDLPGKRPFDLAHRALGSSVEAVPADFMRTDLEALGRFDVVLFLGVLYHMRHPLLALERLASVTGRLALIETEAIWVPGREDRALCEFYENDECGGDPTNWWAPNAAALIGMCRAAGFDEVEVVSSLDEPQRPGGARMPWAKRHADIKHYRLVVQARRTRPK